MKRKSDLQVAQARLAKQAKQRPVDQDDAVIDRNDQVEIASIDSFPASDPPGWVCVAATPKTGRRKK